MKKDDDIISDPVEDEEGLKKDICIECGRYEVLDYDGLCAECAEECRLAE